MKTLLAFIGIMLIYFAVYAFRTEKTTFKEKAIITILVTIGLLIFGNTY